jgi:hypothetical protein
MHFETTTSTITTLHLLTAQMRLMALKRAYLHDGKLRPPQADLSGSGWGLVGQAMRAAADVE